MYTCFYLLCQSEPLIYHTSTTRLPHMFTTRSHIRHVLAFMFLIDLSFLHFLCQTAQPPLIPIFKDSILIKTNIICVILMGVFEFVYFGANPF